MLKTPESYLAILAESSQPRYHVLADKPTMHERQNLALLDALAEICVSQEGETYASALELNAERCTIFIVGNQEQVPQRTQEYLADLCRRLMNIANVADARRPLDKGFPPMIRDSIDEIYRAVLSFTFPKLLARLTKWNDPLCDRIVDIDEIELAEADRKKFGDLTQALNSLYRVVASFKDPMDVEDTKILDNTVGSVSEEWYLNNPDTTTFVHMLDALPTNDENMTPFSIERYLRKILKTYDQTTNGMMVAHDVYPRRLCEGVRSPKEPSSITSVSRVRRLHRGRVEPVVSDKYLGTINERPFSTSQRSAQNDPHLASQNIIVRPSAHRGPFCSAERCPACLEIDADGVQAVMVDLERVQLDDLPDRLTVDHSRNKFVNGIPSEYFYNWFRDLHQYP
ncbi:hypothetical protein ARMSODRAFT_1081699 [Armillaria solidipes]|uniref:Uncharacterized protein n=1 Tax=Armillaria solidipes TaxID=1076256 RepID=A0A2H3CBJ0_9AGAR|nr:hypothetical protein ARMSODRAFT_1081699 [Armillaria solidipes]